MCVRAACSCKVLSCSPYDSTDTFACGTSDRTTVGQTSVIFFRVFTTAVWRLSERCRAQLTTTSTMPPPTSRRQRHNHVKSKILVLFVLLVTWVEGRWTRGQDEDEALRMLGRVVEAVEKGLKFFSDDYSNINLDGVFGIRVGQGQIVLALKECQSSGSCSDSFQRRLQDLNDKMDVTASAASTYVQAMDSDYYERFLGTINKPYLTRYTAVTLTPAHLQKTPPGSEDSYDEDEGDACYSRLLGTYLHQGKPVKKCNVTRSCWNMMTEENRCKYSVTHQLLYFMLVEKQSCVEEIENSMASDVGETEARLCGSIYNEAVSEVKDGEVSTLNQDLFLEQVLLCGCLGFENFMRKDWMRMVLTWQMPSGCFSMGDPDLLATEMALSESREQERQLMKDLQEEVQMIQKQHHSRKLLREQVMSDGCLSHKSGLGFGTLCLYTRYLVRQVFLHQ